MAWISVHQQIRDHRKLRDLFRLLNINRQEALGILVLIWTWALDNCDKDGKLLSVNKFDLAHAAYWTKDPDTLCNALINTGWVDDINDELFLHDWYDFNKPFYDYIDRKSRDRERKKRSNSSGNSAEIPQETLQEFHVSPAPAPAPAPAPKQEPIKSKDIVRFSPPTLTDVKSYCQERNNKVDAEKWHDFYQSKGWMVGKNKMKDWRACVRTWEKEGKANKSSSSSDSFYFNLAQEGNYDDR